MPTFYFFNNILDCFNTNVLQMFNLICEKLPLKSIEQLNFLKQCLLENTLYSIHFNALQLLLTNFSYLVNNFYYKKKKE